MSPGTELSHRNIFVHVDVRLTSLARYDASSLKLIETTYRPTKTSEKDMKSPVREGVSVNGMSTN